MNPSSFLDQVETTTKQDLVQKKEMLSLKDLIQLSLKTVREPYIFEKTLRQGFGPKIIAEVKKKSPSQGDLNSQIDPVALAHDYVSAGASAISVLTESHYFGGSMNDLKRIRNKYPHIILLQKDFVIDPYQIYEAKLLGADAILLIVALLGEKKLVEFHDLASSLGLSCLVEAHTELEVNLALEAGATIIGVNNRDLHRLTISLDVSRRISNLIPNNLVKISESGINSAEEINELAALGYQGFLIGSSFMRTSNPSEQLEYLLKGVKS